MFVIDGFTALAREPQLVVSDEAVIATGERSVVVTATRGQWFDVARG